MLHCLFAIVTAVSTLFFWPHAGSQETVLRRFQGGFDGEGPRAGVIFDAAGDVYGATFGGGGTAVRASHTGSNRRAAWR